MSLKGIIFGIKTKKEDKIKIMQIINAKCEANDRNDFKFYQAFYSPTKKKHRLLRDETIVIYKEI
ncbi:hypothetical protein D0128_24510 [Salmonella enterica]|nr:hypothetical protein [Salmonella enterica]